MSNFKNFLNKELTELSLLDKPNKNGDTKRMVLVALYGQFGDGEFSTLDLRNVKSVYGQKEATNMVTGLVKAGFLTKNGKTLQLTNTAVVEMGGSVTKAVGDDEITQDDIDSAKISKSKVIKNLGKSKTLRFKVPKVSKGSNYLDQMKTLLRHMKSTAEGTTKKTYMLAGDPGTGKTSFIESLGTLTGIPLVVIEAPHITQEHLINIPFLVIDGPKRREGNITVSDSGDDKAFKIVQAESALVTTLKSKKRRSPEQVQKFINQNKVLKDIQPMLKRNIDIVNKQYNAILFLDEFYRTTSSKIRNVLRNILNGKIGDDKIPLGTYIIMASNFNDDGVDDIPENHDFNLMRYDTPDKEDLFNYFYGKYVDNPDENVEFDPENPATRTGVAIKPEVFNTFFDMVKPEDLGKNDEDADVRLSPRRLEQMMIYVDARTPCINMEEVSSLLSYVKNALSNYLEEGEEGTSEMVEPYMALIKEVIKLTSDLDETSVDAAKPLGKTDWHVVLSDQIDAKIQLGESKKYVPIVSGDPGIGKTSAAATLANEKGMGFIQIDISNRAPEDFTGMPNADMSGDNITVQFTEPALYRLIMKEYEAIIDDVKVDGRPYNVILLFDEMNRTRPAVFNAMRKILLEKEFSDSYKLPADIMMMGAINPKGEGTMEFTSHTRDVLDIIPSSAKFVDVMEYSKNTQAMKLINQRIGFNLSDTIAKGLTMLASDFHSLKSAEDSEILDVAEQNFWWTINGEIVYISGREFTEALHEIAAQTEEDFIDMGWDVNAQYEDEVFDEFIDQAVNSFAKFLGMGLNMVVEKMNVEDFVPQLMNRIVNDERIFRLYDVVKSKKSAGEISITDMMAQAEYNEKVLGKAVIGDYVRYTSPTQMTQDVEQLINVLLSKSDYLTAVNKILKIVVKIKKSLEASEANYEYTDKLNHHVKATVKTMIDMGNLPLVELLKNDELLANIENLTAV